MGDAFVHLRLAILVFDLTQVSSSSLISLSAENFGAPLKCSFFHLTLALFIASLQQHRDHDGNVFLDFQPHRIEIVKRFLARAADIHALARLALRLVDDNDKGLSRNFRKISNSQLFTGTRIFTGSPSSTQKASTSGFLNLPHN